MTTLDVKIVGLDDPPAWPEIADKVRWHVKDGVRVGVLEGGMTSGATSYMLLVPITLPIGALLDGPDDDEAWIAVELSKANVDALTAAANGAEARWRGDPT